MTWEGSRVALFQRVIKINADPRTMFSLMSANDTFVLACWCKSMGDEGWAQREDLTEPDRQLYKITHMYCIPLSCMRSSLISDTVINIYFLGISFFNITICITILKTK